MEGFKIAEPDDPNRCQAIASYGQCRNLAVEGQKFCKMHGGNPLITARKNLRNYQLTKFHAQVQRLGDSDEVKSLRDEIGILRMVLEERLNICNDTHDLLLQSGAITDTILKIEKVVASCHKLELSTSQLLDKQAILNFVSQLITIISDEITDDAALGKLANRIMSLVDQTFKDDE